MRNILDKIILEKKKHINQLKEIVDIKSLEQSEYFEIETYSLKNKIIKMLIKVNKKYTLYSEKQIEN